MSKNASGVVLEFRPMARVRVLPWIFLVFAMVLPTIAAPAEEPVRLAMEVFGGEAQIEIRDSPRPEALAAARQALLEMHQVAQLLDLEGGAAGGLGDLQRAPAGSAVTLDPRAFDLLQRTLQFCVWSAGAYSPLGGRVYDLWRFGTPAPLELREALGTASCDGLALSPGPPLRAALTSGARLEITGLAPGFAIDRGIDSLLRAGITNAFIEFGDLVRAIGGGVDGIGWEVEVPGVAGTRHPLDRILLRNQSLSLAEVPRGGAASGSVAAPAARRLVDLRTGVPASGVVLVAAVSEQAVNAKVLSMALYVLGFGDGQRLLGQLDPRPSVLWLLGHNTGTPLESRYRWSALERPPRRAHARP